MSFATIEIDTRIRMALRPVWARLEKIAKALVEVTNELLDIKKRLDALEAAASPKEQP